MKFSTTEMLDEYRRYDLYILHFNLMLTFIALNLHQLTDCKAQLNNNKVKIVSLMTQSGHTK